MKNGLLIIFSGFLAGFFCIVPPENGHTQKDSVSVPVVVATPSPIDSSSLLEIEELHRKNLETKAAILREIKAQERQISNNDKRLDKIAETLKNRDTVVLIDSTGLVVVPIDTIFIADSYSLQPEVHKSWRQRFRELMAECKLLKKLKFKKAKCKQ